MARLIAIVGMAGSGKSVVTEYLEEKGFHKIYFGGVTMSELKKKGMEITPENEKWMREALRKEYGMGAFATLLLDEIASSVNQGDTILDGLYSWDEYKILKEKFPNLSMVAVVTDRHLRTERVGKRKIRPLTPEEVLSRDIAEIENVAKGGPIAFADYFLLNNFSISKLYEQIDGVLASILQKGGQ